MNKQTILVDKVSELSEQISQLQTSFNDIVDIANFQELNKEVSELLIQHAEKGKNTISLYSKVEEILFELLKKDENTDLPPSQESEDKEISLRPDFTRKISSQESVLNKLINEPLFVDDYNMLMKELYALRNTETYYMDFTGIYPRINCVQGCDSSFVQKWFNFGVINAIYMTTPTFAEISKLPKWIQEGVKQIYQNNPTYGPKDILMLKIVSAGPDFEKTERFDAYHHLKLLKYEELEIKVYSDRKEYEYFSEDKIHYRRALGMRIVLQSLENTPKLGFRTYGGNGAFSSVMTTYAGRTPEAARNYLNWKIRLLDSCRVKSSEKAVRTLCRMRRHRSDTCPACMKDKGKEKDKDSTESMG